MSSESIIKISVVDDHSLFRKGVVKLIEQVNPRFKVISEASHGQEFLAQLESKLQPNVVVLDLDMPRMDGLETTKILKEKYPEMGILMLTMKDDEESLIKLLKEGVNGYLNKDVDPQELERALISVVENGYHYTDIMTSKLVNALQKPNSGEKPKLNKQEVRFIKLACSELTYKEIAFEMCLSEKTIDGYRARLFEKLEVKSRVGIVLYAVKNQLISIQ